MCEILTDVNSLHRLNKPLRLFICNDFKLVRSTAFNELQERNNSYI